MRTINAPAVCVLTIVATLAGCAAPPALIRETASGFPEAVFTGSGVDETKAAIMNGCLSNGIAVDDTGTNHVVCAREMQGGQAVALQLAIGNGYSTTPVAKMRFTLIPSGDDTRVTARSWAETQMAMGQVRSVEFNGHADRNTVQAFLSSIGGQ